MTATFTPEFGQRHYHDVEFQCVCGLKGCFKN